MSSINKTLIFSMLFGVILAYSAMNQNSDFAAGSGIKSDECNGICTYVYSYINISYCNIESDEWVFRTEKGKYGEGKVSTLVAEIVHVTTSTDRNDHFGCNKDMLGNLGNPLPNKPWIALIKRGKCSFESKVHHAWINYASGVIVYNDKESINLDKMSISGKNRDIPAVFTYKWVGEDLAELAENGSFNLTVGISEGMRGGVLCNPDM